MAKQISVSDLVYTKLSEIKGYDSFSTVILKILKGQAPSTPPAKLDKPAIREKPKTTADSNDKCDMCCLSCNEGKHDECTSPEQCGCSS